VPNIGLKTASKHYQTLLTMMLKTCSLALAAALLLVSPAAAEPLRIVSWNVESDGNDPAVIAEQLVELGPASIIALQEVHSRNIGRYGNAVQQGLARSYRYVSSNTGRSDRLMILYDSSTLDLVEVRELFSHEALTLNDWRHRSPLVAHFKHQASGQEFLFVTVHLARGNAALRTEQARGLREWAREQTLPVVAAGDFNMDFDFGTRSGNEAFVEFQQDSVWKWLPPDPLADTNWADTDGDGRDNYPDSMLDFAFVAGAAKAWPATSTVLVRPGDFPDDERTSDHRPIQLNITPAQ
jgi:endonuclease/exonuclease/phosphatase family metal-dependent hydrolase